MGDYSAGIIEGVGCHFCKTGRVRIRPSGFFEFYNSQRRSGRKGKPRGPVPECGRGGGELKEVSPHSSFGGSLGSALQLLDLKTSFVGWMIALPRFVLASRAALSWNLRESFSVRWQGSSLRTAMFPLPVPFPGIFDGSGPGLSKKRLRVLAQKRLLHLIVLALNRLYLGRFASLAELRRPPSPLQLSILDRLYGFITVSGLRSESFKVPPGRSGPELIACLARLESFLAERPEFNGSYTRERSPTSFKPPALPVEQYPQLAPYKSLDAQRLLLRGTGEWPLADYLEGELWLPYVEPSFLCMEDLTTLRFGLRLQGRTPLSTRLWQ